MEEDGGIGAQLREFPLLSRALALLVGPCCPPFLL